MRYTMSKLPRPARRKLLHSRPAQYEMTACFAGKTEPVHAKIIEKGMQQYVIPVRGQADILITATTAMNPVVSGAWLSPGTHINAIGANFAQKRELETDAVDRAGIIAVDSIQQANIESGDLIQAFGDDNSRWPQVRELCEIVAGKRPGRKNPEQITLFKSNGIASWDLAVGAQVFERAEKEGLGRKIEFGSHR